MQVLLIATSILLATNAEPTPSVIQDAYTIDIKHSGGTYKVVYGPGLEASFFTKKEVGFRSTITLHGKEFEVRAVMDPDEQYEANKVDLVLGPEILKEFVIRVEPFRRRSTLLPRSELSKQISGMALLEPPRGDLENKKESFRLSCFGGFEMLRILELPVCGARVRGVEFLKGSLGFRAGKRVVYRVEDEEEIMVAGFADLPFQSVVYDFRTGATYGSDPVPAYVPTFFSVVRQPMEFKQGKLYLLGDEKPLIEVHALPIATYCDFLRIDLLKTTFEKGYLAVRTEGEPVKRIPVFSD